MDEGMRDVYNRFGPSHLTFDPRKDELKLITDMAIPLLFWGVTAFVMTSAPGAAAARNWIAIAAIGLLAVESIFYLSETTVPLWMVPSTLTEHEVIFYLHSAFPAIIALLSALATSLYVDVDHTVNAVLAEVMDHQKTVLKAIDQIESLAAIATKPELTKEDVDEAEIHRSKLNTLRDTMEKNNDELARRVEDLRASNANPGSQHHWVIFVLLYGGIYFLQ